MDQNEPQCELWDKNLIFNFKVALTLVAVALTPPKFNHTSAFMTTLKALKISIHKFLSYAGHEQTDRLTNPNDYITSAGTQDYC